MQRKSKGISSTLTETLFIEIALQLSYHHIDGCFVVHLILILKVLHFAAQSCRQQNCP